MFIVLLLLFVQVSSNFGGSLLKVIGREAVSVYNVKTKMFKVTSQDTRITGQSLSESSYIVAYFGIEDASLGFAGGAFIEIVRLGEGPLGG